MLCFQADNAPSGDDGGRSDTLTDKLEMLQLKKKQQKNEKNYILIIYYSRVVICYICSIHTHIFLSFRYI